MNAVDERAQVRIGGCRVDLRVREDALEAIGARSRSKGGRPLAVASVNLDHVHHFGRRGRWEGALESPDGVDWLFLIDGAPVAAQATRMSRRSWPRLAGSDLIGAVLADAERDGVSVGFLGASRAAHVALAANLAREFPLLRVAGHWSPTREEIEDHERSAAVAADIAAKGSAILIVGLGKPQQELWIARHGAASGARVLLGFDAVLDGATRRRAARCLLDGPPAYREVRRRRSPEPLRRLTEQLPPAVAPPTAGFIADGPVDIAVVAVTFNNAEHVAGLLDSLMAESADLRLRVVATDNGSTDGTPGLLADHPGVIVVDGGGNRGYATGINLALQRAGQASAVLVLNPDLEVGRGALLALYTRLRESRAGAAVPRIAAPDGSIYPSLRREPTVMRTVGDALLGSRLPHRPIGTSEIDARAESYRHAHPIEWATGAAILVDAAVAAEVGEWDPRFFLYSEETDFFARMRALGYSAWFEPRATVRHDRGGSGASTELAALMAVNRVRYARKHRSPVYAAAVHSAVILHEAVRSYNREHRSILRTLVDQGSWRRLLHASRWPAATTGTPLGGAIVIPAHNEEAVIGRTLRSLATLATNEGTEIVVSCNACSDHTEDIARQTPGVNVVATGRASKAAALNAGDEAVSRWPRIYLDADIDLHPGAVRAVFAALGEPGVLAARPAFRYDTAGASPAVRAYYRARNRMPAAHGALWGAGVYALNEEGHRRLGAFPEQTSDDLLVDLAFRDDEKRIVDTEPARVRTPRSVRGLLAILSRQQRGNREAAVDGTGGSTARALLSTVHGPLTLADAAVYAGLALFARRARPRRPVVWERDDSSRVPPA